MVLVGFFCVLGAVGLLVVGLVQADPDLVWASIGASAVGGVAVAIGSIQRSRALKKLMAKPPVSAAAKSVLPKTLATKPVAKAEESKPEEPKPEDSTAEQPRTDPARPQPAGTRAAPEVGTGPEAELPKAEPAAAEPYPDQPLDDDEAADPVDEPAEEDVDMADLLVVIDLTDEVLVVDLRPRYHRAACSHLDGREAIPIPVNQAREDGFTPCALCQPDTALAAAAREAQGRLDPPAGKHPGQARPLAEG